MVAAIVIAILPMVFLGAGVVPTPHSTTPAELSRVSKSVVLGPEQYSEAQYRADRHTLAYARRANELNKLRELAVEPLAAWIAAPAGEPEEDGGAKAITVRTEGPATVTVVTAPAGDNSPGTVVDVTITPAAPIEKPAVDEPAVAPAKPTAALPAATITDAPQVNAAAQPPPASGQVYAALNPASKEAAQTAIPQIRVILQKPKPRAKIVRRYRAAPKPVPVVQKPPFADFPLLAWLFAWQQPQQPAVTTAAQNKTSAR